MTDIEINRKLALAIGWKYHDIVLSFLGDHIWLCTHVATLHAQATHRRFDYKDPLVIWPIAERYAAFPTKGTPNWWYVPGSRRNGSGADTAAKAVALSVIGRKS